MSHITNINLNTTGVADATLAVGGSAGNGTLNATSKPPVNKIKGGTYCFLASGTFQAGRTLTLKQKVGDAYVNVGDDAILTSPGGCVFTTSQSDVELVVSGGSSAYQDDLHVTIAPVN